MPLSSFCMTDSPRVNVTLMIDVSDEAVMACGQLKTRSCSELWLKSISVLLEIKQLVPGHNYCGSRVKCSWEEPKSDHFLLLPLLILSGAPLSLSQI